MNTRKTGRVRVTEVESSSIVWWRGTAPFALLMNTRKTGRGIVPCQATAMEGSFAVWRRGTAPFALPC